MAFAAAIVVPGSPVVFSNTMTLLAALLLAASGALAAPSQPNIIFFLTDDQDIEMGSLAYMPKVQRLLIDEGAVFTRMYAHVPVCCPSRSSLISGQFLHNNGCRGNAIATNCSSPQFQRGPEARSYVVDLAAAGYKASFAGKSVAGRAAPAPAPPPSLPHTHTHTQHSPLFCSRACHAHLAGT